MKVNGAEPRAGVTGRGGTGERMFESLLGEALREGVAETRFLPEKMNKALVSITEVH